MIEHGAVERLGRVREPAGHAAIGIAGRRVTARVVMGKDDPGASVGGGIGDDLAHREIGAGLVTLVAGKMEAAGLIVDMRDPQAFTARVGIGDAAGEEAARGSQAIELERKFGTLKPPNRKLRTSG